MLLSYFCRGTLIHVLEKAMTLFRIKTVKGWTLDWPPSN